LCAFWGNNSMTDIDEIILTITTPSHCIIDISFAFTLGIGATRAVTLTANATLTGIAYAPLDNAIASGAVGPNIAVIQGLPSVLINVP